MRLQAVFIFGTLCLLAAGGCGEAGTSWVSGSVVFDGQEVPSGTLRFLPGEGNPGKSAGAEIVNGHYEIAPEMAKKRNLVAGGHRVVVTANRKTGETYPNPEGEGVVEQVQMYIPSRYNRETELYVELQPGENSFDLVLEADVETDAESKAKNDVD